MLTDVIILELKICVGMGLGLKNTLKKCMGFSTNFRQIFASLAPADNSLTSYMV